MMIHAYSEDYLNNAQKILGDMMDYAVNTYEFSPNQFYEMFLVSDVSMQFQTGNPTYVAGKTGCELVKEVIRKSGLLIPELEDEMYLDKSPEYWCGWALAYYQWYTGRSFHENLSCGLNRRDFKHVSSLSRNGYFQICRNHK